MGHIGEALSNHHFLNFSDGSFVSQQSGVVRTNCLDCLDRTNAVQTVIGRAALTFILSHNTFKALEALVNILNEMNIDESQASRFNEAVKGLWSESGNAISHMYAGTGALESGSKLQDATRSISRTIKNNTGSDGKSSVTNLYNYICFRK
jgi:synaptojanin